MMNTEGHLFPFSEAHNEKSKGSLSYLAPPILETKEYHAATPVTTAMMKALAQLKDILHEESLETLHEAERNHLSSIFDKLKEISQRSDLGVSSPNPGHQVEPESVPEIHAECSPPT
jgi:hypothetical protein